ncbi:MAG: hypothetical protein CMP67_04615 [Flavobacteriales bacterium]|nr:hypothetical protein [Flavobacteriales bacterium]
MKSKIIPFILLLSVVACEKESSDDLRNDFVGNWLVNESSKLLGQRTYLVTLSKDSLSDAQIIIDNFYKIGEGENVISSISTTESNTITIPGQNIKNNYIEGIGKLNNDIIELNYFVNDGNSIDTVNANYTRDNN